MTKTAPLTISILLAVLAPRAHAENPAEILARAKEATGGKAWDTVQTLYTRAQVSTSGLTGTAESWEDVRTGRFLDTYTLGPYKGADGFDGQIAWTQDPLFRAKVLKLGSVEVPAPVTDIALVEKGSFSDRYVAGNVGGGVLKRFDVTFDYARQTHVPAAQRKLREAGHL